MQVVDFDSGIHVTGCQVGWFAIEDKIHYSHWVTPIGKASLSVKVDKVGFPESPKGYQTWIESSKQPTAMKSRQASIVVMQSASWIDSVYRKFLEFAYISKRYCNPHISEHL